MSSDFSERPLSSRIGFQGQLLTLKEDKVLLSNGSTGVREYVLHPGAAMIIPLFDDGTVLLERQFRYPVGLHFLELPAGKIDPGETPLATAQRELLEETGYGASQWHHLATIHPCIGYSNERIEMFLARGLQQQGHCADADELLECLQMDFDEALRMVRSGEITDGKTILGLLWADKLRNGKWT